MRPPYDRSNRINKPRAEVWMYFCGQIWISFWISFPEAAPDVEAPPEGAKTILKAAKKSNLESLELIQLILDGKIQVIARQRSLRGLLSLFVDLDDILKLRQVAPNLYTLKHAAKRFGQTYNAMQVLTREGAIPSIPNPSTRQPSRLVTLEDCQKFFQEYASVGELAARSGQSPNTLVRVLTLMDVEPISTGSRMQPILCPLIRRNRAIEVGLDC